MVLKVDEMLARSQSQIVGPKSRVSWSFKEDWPFLLGLAAVLFLLWKYGYKDFWIPADEGQYAHQAERALNGQVPERDFLTLKGGIYLWANVAAFKLLGVKLSALRWPCLIVAVAQAPLVYLMMRPIGRWTAVLGVVWFGALGLPAIPSPASGLFSKVFLVGALMIAAQQQPWKSRSKLLALGALIGLVFCCRQLDAVFLGCGLLSWVLAHPGLEDRAERGILGRGLLLCSAFAVTWYGLGRSDLLGKIVFGMPPIILAWDALARGRPSTKEVLRILKWGGAGFVLSFLPVVIPNLLMGNLSNWFKSVFVTSLVHLKFHFLSTYYVSNVLGAIVSAIPEIRSPLALVQFVTWLFLFFVSFAVGAYCLFQRCRGKEIPAYVFCGPFLALGTIHMEIAIFLLWSIPIAILGGIYCLNRFKASSGFGLIVGTILLLGFFNSVVGKPVWLREQKDFVLTGWGGRLPLTYLGGAADLYVPGPYADFYERSLALIQREANPTETIFCFPYHPEWYVLARRKNPTSLLIPGMEMVDESTYLAAQAELAKSPPKLVIFRRNDICTTPYTQRLRAWLEPSYEIIHDEADYEFLRRKDGSHLDRP